MSVEWLLGLLAILSLNTLRISMISSFKISYYERKLENRGVDISEVKDMGLIDIINC